MLQTAHGQLRPARFAWLIGCVLCLSVWVAWGQDGVAQWASQDSLEKAQKNLQQLSRQVSQLRSTAAQEGLLQKKQNESIQQKMDGLELGQDALGMQLAELQQQILQQVKDLQDVNRQLLAALWSLASLTSLLMLLWVWRYRRALPTSQATPTPLPSPSPSPLPRPSPSPQAHARTNQSALWPPTESENLSVKADTEQAAPFSSDPELPVLPSADWTAPWSDVLSTDLKNTQNTLAQARLDFMRAAHIEP